jgi:hypothetical protein
VVVVAGDERVMKGDGARGTSLARGTRALRVHSGVFPAAAAVPFWSPDEVEARSAPPSLTSTRAACSRIPPKPSTASGQR